MRNNSPCGKCGSSDIIRVPSKVGPYGTGNYIPIGRWDTHSVLVTRYICAGCGFSEEWIDSREQVERVRAQYAPGAGPS